MPCLCLAFVPLLKASLASLGVPKKSFVVCHWSNWLAPLDLQYVCFEVSGDRPMLFLCLKVIPCMWPTVYLNTQWNIIVKPSVHTPYVEYLQLRLPHVAWENKELTWGAQSRSVYGQGSGGLSRPPEANSSNAKMRALSWTFTVLLNFAKKLYHQNQTRVHTAHMHIAQGGSTGKTDFNEWPAIGRISCKKIRYLKSIRPISAAESLNFWSCVLFWF